MQFIAISTLLVSAGSATALAQPSPEMAIQWQKAVSPKIESHFKAELQKRKLKTFGKTRFMARAYLEKDGSIRNLRIDKQTVHSDLRKPELTAIEDALLSAIKASAPLPYSSVKDSRLSHLGLFVEYDSAVAKIDPGLTQPEDQPGP